MFPAVVNFGASSSGIGALGFSGSAFLIQLITFILAFLVLRRYAFGPILKVLRERRETIEKGVSLGEQMQKQAAELEDKVEKTLGQARAQADEIISGAQETARGVIKDAEDKAKEKAGSLVKSAEQQIALETAQARSKLEKEVVGLIAETTSAVLKEKVDAKKDAQVIERALKEQQA